MSTPNQAIAPTTKKTDQGKCKLVIIGGGFAGLAVARAMADQPDWDVTLVDRNNYHLFQPLLYQVATGDLQADAIATPLRKILIPQRCRFHMGEVQAIDPEGKTITLTDNRTLDWNNLVLACGTTTNFFGNRGIAQHAFHLKGIVDADKTRTQVLRCLEQASLCDDATERRKWLTFVIAGGGATGVEYCGALIEQLSIILARHYPELTLDETKIYLVQGGEHLLEGFPSRLQKKAAEILRQSGVEILFGTHVNGFDGHIVDCGEKAAIPSHTLVWAAGVSAPGWLDGLVVEKGHGGRIVVDEHLRIAGLESIFVAGDLAISKNQKLLWPQVAPFAKQTGAYVARYLRNQTTSAFSYRDPGSMAVIRRFNAVAYIPRWRTNKHGFLAWLLWLWIHLYGLIGTRNRMLTLLDWSTDYLRHGAAVQLIRYE